MGSSSKSFDERAFPALLSYLLHWALQGVLTVQVYFYYLNFPQDPLRFKCLVYCVFILEWVDWGLVTEDAFVTFVFGATNGVGEYNTSDADTVALPIMASLVSSIVQCFFAWRIYTLSKRSILTGIIVVLCVIQSSFGFATSAKLVHTPSVGDVLASTSGRAIIIIWIGGTVLVDVIIAIAMTLLMLKMRTSFAHSNRIVNKLIRFTLETGTLTAGNSIIGVILALAFPNQSYYMPAMYNGAKLYAISLVAHLLSRAYLSGPASTVNHNDHILTSMTSAHTSTPTRDIEMSSLNYKVPTLAGTMASD